MKTTPTFNPGLTRYAIVGLLARKLTISQTLNLVGEARHGKSLIERYMSKRGILLKNDGTITP